MHPNEIYVNKVLDSAVSKNTKRNWRRLMRSVVNYLYDQFGEKMILDYSVEEIREVLSWIESLNVVVENKRRFLKMLRKLIEEAQFPYRIMNKRYNEVDYEFLLKTQKFSDSGSYRVKKRYISAKEWNSVLLKAKETDLYDFLMFGLFRSSCRIGGLVALKWENIDYRNCCFDTIEKTGRCRYFYAEEFNPILRYINQFNKRDPIFVFSRTDKTLRKHVKKYGKFKPHDLRRSMERLWMEAKMDIAYRNLFSNHSQSAIMDTLYVIGNMMFDEPAKAHQIYQKYYNLIF